MITSDYSVDKLIWTFRVIQSVSLFSQSFKFQIHTVLYYLFGQLFIKELMTSTNLDDHFMLVHILC